MPREKNWWVLFVAVIVVRFPATTRSFGEAVSLVREEVEEIEEMVETVEVVKVEEGST